MSNFDNADAEKLMQSNYDELRKARIEMGFDLDQLNGHEQDIKSGHYTAEGVASIQKEIDGLKRKIDSKKMNLEASLTAKLDNFVSEHTPRLDPAEVTDDIKLLNCGVKLREAEIEQLLNKCMGNYTMTILLLRYAEERELKLGNDIMGRAMLNTGSDALRAFSREERERIQYSLKWLDNLEKGKEMLNRFYGVSA